MKWWRWGWYADDDDRARQDRDADLEFADVIFDTFTGYEGPSRSEAEREATGEAGW